MSGISKTQALETFGARLKQARKSAGWTQSQLAARTGFTTSSIAQFETDARKPSFDSLRRLTMALSITSDYLLGLADKPVVIGSKAFIENLEKLSGDDRILLDEFVAVLVGRINLGGKQKQGEYV